MITTRRSFLRSALLAPAVVSASSLMPISALWLPPKWEVGLKTDKGLLREVFNGDSVTWLSVSEPMNIERLVIYRHGVEKPYPIHCTGVPCVLFTGDSLTVKFRGDVFDLS